MKINSEAGFEFWDIKEGISRPTEGSNRRQKESYYTEIGIKINQFRVSVRIPTSTKSSSSKPITSYYTVTKRSPMPKTEQGVIDVEAKDWEWRPSPKSSPNPSPKLLRTSTPLPETNSLPSTICEPYDVLETFQSPFHRTLKEPQIGKKLSSTTATPKKIGIPVAPPVPPRSKSPSTPPLSARPPYPSSTVQRKRINQNNSSDQEINQNSVKRQYSYV